MPADLEQSWLDAPIAAFAARHPEIRLELDLTGRVVNLIEEGFDLAIRAGEAVPPGLTARLLTRMPTALYASPGYLAALPALGHPRELLPEPIARREIDAGRLLRVLRGWRGSPVSIHTVYASRRMPLRLRLFLDHLRTTIA